MDFIEVIGFLIGIIAMFFIWINKMRDERLRKNNPEAWRENEARKKHDLKQLLRSMDIDLVDEEEEEKVHYVHPVRQVAPPQSKPKPKPQPVVNTPVPNLKPIQVPRVINDTYSPIKVLFKDKESLRKAILMREVISAPRAYKPYEPLQ